MSDSSDVSHKITQGLMRNIIALRAIPLFANVNTEIMVPVAEIAQELTFTAGEVVFEEQERSADMYVIVHGRVELSVGGRGVATLSRADSFGVLALLDSAPRRMRATALEVTSALAIDSTSFSHLLRIYPELGRVVALELTRMVRDGVAAMDEG